MCVGGGGGSRGRGTAGRGRRREFEFPDSTSRRRPTRAAALVAALGALNEYLAERGDEHCQHIFISGLESREAAAAAGRVGVAGGRAGGRNNLSKHIITRREAVAYLAPRRGGEGSTDSTEAAAAVLVAAAAAVFIAALGALFYITPRSRRRLPA